MALTKAQMGCIPPGRCSCRNSFVKGLPSRAKTRKFVLGFSMREILVGPAFTIIDIAQSYVYPVNQ